MSKRFPIINPKANCVIGMYVHELVDMNHPIAGIRFTSKNDAHLSYQQAVPLKAAIKSILAHIRYLFGEDIPEELVMATVYLVYIENTVLRVRKIPVDNTPVDEQPVIRPPIQQRPIDIHKEYVALWLKHERSVRESLRPQEGTNTFQTKNKENKKQYPILAVNANNIAGWRIEIPENATINEILAQAIQAVMGRNTQSYIYLSERETIKIMPPRSDDGYKEYSYIEAYDRVLIFPEGTTKDELIVNATEIAGTWCPTACVRWSATETIWPKKNGNMNGSEKSIE